ncbi:MAG: ABC transporter permease subunit [Anaerolineae bacterium]
MQSRALPSLSPWRRLRYGLSNPPLLIGAALASALFLTAYLGPLVLPLEGLQIDRVRTFEGELDTAPFPPSEEFPLGSDALGRDLLTVLLFGASQTLAIAGTVALARLFLGMTLGTLAGWNRDGVADRAVMGLVGYLAPFPTLILAMGLIFALGIRRGQSSFVLALSIVGWTQIAQYVRSEVMLIKERPFIEGARAIGLADVAILTRHVFPNVLPTLLTLASLEMASSLLIWAELGFVGVFVGGGLGVASLDAASVLSTFDAPEWGALLGSSWRFLRTATWVPFFPAAAFFVSILCFNLLGMGLQTFFERSRINVASLSLGRFAVAAALAFLAIRTILANTGAEADLARLARQFDGEAALQDVAFLASPERDGRLVGTEGSQAAAEYLIERFQEAGLQRISLREGEGYIQRFTRKRVDALGVPELSVLGLAGSSLEELEYRSEFAEKGYSGGGEAEGELLVAHSWLPFNVDASGKIVLLITDDPTVWLFGDRPPAFNPEAVLTVVSDIYPLDQRRPSLFHDSEPFNLIPDQQWSNPWFNISVGAADRLLAGSGQTVAELRQALEGAQTPVVETSIHVRVSHPIRTIPEVEATNVLGVLPGIDFDLSQEYVVLAAHYAGPGRDLDGTLYPAANDNASGVAILLEVARLWQQIGFEPRRTVAFVAWDEKGSRYYASRPTSAFRPGQVLAVIQLRSLGRGEEAITISERASPSLIEAAQSAASRLGISSRLSRQFLAPYFRPEEYPMLVLTREGGQATTWTPRDTLEGIDSERLSEAGQMAALLAMILSTQ